jgi:hypothetical protein
VFQRNDHSSLFELIETAPGVTAGEIEQRTTASYVNSKLRRLLDSLPSVILQAGSQSAYSNAEVIDDAKSGARAASYAREHEAHPQRGRLFFCTANDATIAAALLHRSLAAFRQDECVALVLAEDDARQQVFDLSMPMCRIVLEVLSALDGVGLSAGVATALADDGIPCNMIAAYHHDNVFAPESMAHRAINILKDVQRKAASAES